MKLRLRLPKTLASFLTYLNRRQISLAVTANFFKKLSYLLASGISLQNALAVMKKSARPELATKIEQVRFRLFEGQEAFEAFSDFPHLAGEIGYLIKVGEETAKLAQVFMEISRYFEDSLRLRAKILRSLSYPIFVTVICFLSLIVISVFLLPNFKNLFESSNIQIPALTQFFIDFGVFLQVNGKYLLLTGLLLGITVKIQLRKQRVKAALSKFWLKVPGLASIINNYIHLRMVKVLSTLLGAKLPLTRALHSVQKTVSHPVFNPVFSSIISDVETGNNFSDAIQKHKQISPLLKEIVVVAEETGDMLSLLNGLAAVLEEELEAGLKRITMFLEPAATLGVGVLVGLVAISMLYPMGELMNSIR